MIVLVENGAFVADLNAAPLAHRRNPGVLIADDQGLILVLLKIALQARGFDVWLVADGSAAIEVYRRHRDEIDLVLLDVDMPGLDGPRTLASLQELFPFVRACFMTRSDDSVVEDDLLARGAIRVFTKPFRADEVAEFLQSLVSSRADTRPTFPARNANGCGAKTAGNAPLS